MPAILKLMAISPFMVTNHAQALKCKVVGWILDGDIEKTLPVRVILLRPPALISLLPRILLRRVSGEELAVSLRKGFQVSRNTIMIILLPISSHVTIPTHH
jgi:hypothetical protein